MNHNIVQVTGLCDTFQTPHHQKRNKTRKKRNLNNSK